MKKNNTIWLLLLALCSIFASCKKEKTSSPAQDNVLPPATQTGANTFGCYINGQLFVPRGYTNPYPNYRMIVDPGANGNLDIRTYSYQNQIEMQLGFSSFGINTTALYTIGGASQIYPYYKKDVNSNVCRYLSDSNNYKSGYIRVTKYDLANGIFSGEFEMKLYDPNISCDTIRITQGRFDKKL